MTCRSPLISSLALGLVAGASGCAAPAAGTIGAPRPDYMGVETQLLGDDLVDLKVTASKVTSTEQIERYAECAAAQYALIRGYGFARHIRTNITQEGGIWRGDAVYTVSSALPPGLKTLDAEVVAANCAENGIPMV